MHTVLACNRKRVRETPKLKFVNIKPTHQFWTFMTYTQSNICELVLTLHLPTSLTLCPSATF